MCVRCSLGEKQTPQENKLAPRIYTALANILSRRAVVKTNIFDEHLKLTGHTQNKYLTPPQRGQVTHRGPRRTIFRAWGSGTHSIQNSLWIFRCNAKEDAGGAFGFSSALFPIA
jgi:hypothetical protein